jgi:hypothetical protein
VGTMVLSNDFRHPAIVARSSPAHDPAGGVPSRVEVRCCLSMSTQYTSTGRPAGLPPRRARGRHLP